jgi:D-psicose/D-tagatose/L-ribulose 3-epimerase
MRLSFSNIAWDIAEEPAIADLLREHGVDRVDLAPGKYFADPAAATAGDIAAVRTLWEGRGFGIEGMQALLFGTTGLNLFADPDDAMIDRLAAVCRLASGLGARALTFGSPRQRDRAGLSDADADRIATDFFRRLGNAAVDAGVIVCLEPNPAIYGCNFMVRTDEAAAMVTRVDHPGIALQLDVGALALNGEPVAETITRHAALIGHVHASEPQLVTLGDGGALHAEAGVALRRARPDLTVTVEMVASTTQPHLAEVARALSVAQLHYGDGA